MKKKKLNHAERLLLNHGYLRDAIDTENNAYLESDTVRKIFRKTFYGTEEVHQQTVGHKKISYFFSVSDVALVTGRIMCLIKRLTRNRVK